MERLARIEGSAWSSGIFLDLKQQTAPFWTSGTNVIFQNGAVGVWPGSLPLFVKTKSGLLTGLGELSPLVTGAPGVVYGFNDTLHCWDAESGVQNLGSGYTGSVDQTVAMPATRWSFTQWNEWIAATNGVDPVQLCKVLGTGFEDMNTSTQFERAEILNKYRQFMIAFNLTLEDDTKQSNAVAWCDVNDPDTWVPAATNSARKIYIPAMNQGILAVEPFQEAFFMYGQDLAYALSYSGFPNVFEPQQLAPGVGVYGKNCVCSVKGRHVGIGPRGIWSYDGNSYEYIDNPALKKHLDATLNKDQASKIVVYNDRTINHVLFFYPTLGNTENFGGVAWNYTENHFSPISFGRSVGLDSGVLDFGITGDLTGQVYKQSLQDVPVSDSASSNIPITEGGEVDLGFGESGFGDYGYGGVIYV